MAKYYKFDSGLTLLYERNKINQSTSLGIVFKCGSMVDGKLAGLSHFCEHMFFSGTDKLSKAEATKRYFDFINVNAFTSFKNIEFVGLIMTNKLRDYLFAVQDMICNSTFTPKAVEEEKQVVIQEIVKNTDNHNNHFYDIKFKELFHKEYYLNGILGTQETVSKITSKDVKNYVKKYFVKSNCTISICTPLHFNKVKRIIKKYFESKLPTSNLKPLKYDNEKLIDDEKVSVFTKDIDKNFLSLVFKFKRKGPDLHYRSLLCIICNMISDIGDGILKDLRIENNLVYSAGTDNFINKENSYLEIITQTSKGNIKPCLDVIFKYISNLRNNGFTKQQFDKEIVKCEYYDQVKVLTPDDIRCWLGKYKTYNRFLKYNELYQQMKTLTLEEVNNTFKQLLAESKLQLIVYGNATPKDVYTIKQIQKKFK